MQRLLRCYAEERDGEWEAFCLDLDLAVQGKSFEEVYRSLNDTISLYLESVSSLSQDDQKRLLKRRAPVSLRFKFLMLAVKALFSPHDSGRSHHQFTLTCAA